MAEKGTFGNPEVVEVETDLLIIGGGMAACGAAVEAKRWAPKDAKITLVDKAALDRSGAVAQGALGHQHVPRENDPRTTSKMVANDLMGITRDDLVYDVGRHVDDSVQLFEEWGLPVWKRPGDEGKSLKDGGKPVRSGRWQIMINGESYKVIVAEAAKKALGMENIYERVFIVKLVLDAKNDNQIAAAVGFSTREHKLYVFKAKAMLNVCGGAVNVFGPGPWPRGWGRPGTRCGTPAPRTPWRPKWAPS